MVAGASRTSRATGRLGVVVVLTVLFVGRSAMRVPDNGVDALDQ